MNATPIKSGDAFADVYADGDHEEEGERADGPVCAVFEVDVFGQGALADEAHGEGSDEHDGGVAVGDAIT